MIGNGKISVSTNGVLRAYDYDAEFVFRRLKEIGYGAADVMLCMDWNKPNPIFESGAYSPHYEKMGQIAQRAGLEVFQTHGYFPTDGQNEEWLIKTFERQIHATSLLGAKYIVIHPKLNMRDFEAGVRENVAFFRALRPALERHGVTACLENLWEYDPYPVIRPSNIATVKQILEIINQLDGEHFGICIDTGHALLVGSDPAEEIRAAGQCLKVLHINDNDRNEDSHRMPLFGKADWKGIMLALKEVNYRGAFNMEINISGRVGKTDRELIWDMETFAYRIAEKLIREENI